MLKLKLFSIAAIAMLAFTACGSSSQKADASSAAEAATKGNWYKNKSSKKVRLHYAAGFFYFFDFNVAALIASITPALKL